MNKRLNISNRLSWVCAVITTKKKIRTCAGECTLESAVKAKLKSFQIFTPNPRRVNMNTNVVLGAIRDKKKEKKRNRFTSSFDIHYTSSPPPLSFWTKSKILFLNIWGNSATQFTNSNFRKRKEKPAKDTIIKKTIDLECSKWCVFPFIKR